MRITEWVAEYLDHLTPNIRPRDTDSRFLTAAHRANLNGWTPFQAAAAVTVRRYDTSINPVLIAIQELERVTSRPPQHRGDSAGTWYDNLPDHCPHPNAQALDLKPNQCRACRASAGAPPPFVDNTPRPPRIPPEWVAERAALIRELLHTTGLTDDQREQLMIDLIHEQRHRGNHGRS